MTTDNKELVKRLRATMNWGGSVGVRPINQDGPEAADALEALAGEVERLTSDVDALGDNLEKAIAERDRLKAALQPFSDAYERLVRTQESMGFSDNATFGLGIKVSAIKVARKVLGGDA